MSGEPPVGLRIDAVASEPIDRRLLPRSLFSRCQKRCLERIQPSRSVRFERSKEAGKQRAISQTGDGRQRLVLMTRRNRIQIVGVINDRQKLLDSADSRWYRVCMR